MKNEATNYLVKYYRTVADRKEYTQEGMGIYELGLDKC